MSSLTNGDDTQRGYDDGLKDASNNRNKNFGKMVTKDNFMKFMIHGNLTLNTYTNGYNLGYIDGLRKKNGIYSANGTSDNVTTKNTSSMAYLQDIEREIEAVLILNHFLADVFHENALTVRENFNGYINAMRDTGVPAQVCDTFQDKYFSLDDNNLGVLCNNLHDDVNATVKYIEALIDQYNMAAEGQSYGAADIKYPRDSFNPITPREAQTSSVQNQDYEEQLKACAAMINYLVTINKNLDNITELYQRSYNNMIDSGVPRQIYEHYAAEFIGRNISQLKLIKEHIGNEDYPYLTRVFATIENSLNKLGQTSNISYMPL